MGLSLPYALEDKLSWILQCVGSRKYYMPEMLGNVVCWAKLSDKYGGVHPYVLRKFT